jgi:hypothetical protein
MRSDRRHVAAAFLGHYGNQNHRPLHVLAGRSFDVRREIFPAGAQSRKRLRGSLRVRKLTAADSRANYQHHYSYSHR